MFLAGTFSPAQTTASTQTQVKKTPSTASKTSKTPSTSAHKGSSKRRKSRRTGAGARKRGQQAIDPKRAQEIQQALIREHYLSGEPSSTWNDASQKAMQRYQADHGWQSKQVPDSRALIKLGLGPDQEHLLNPESAMTTQPAATHPPAPASTQVAPAGTDTRQR
jgi:hypothetical protein